MKVEYNILNLKYFPQKNKSIVKVTSKATTRRYCFATCFLSNFFFFDL